MDLRLYGYGFGPGGNVSPLIGFDAIPSRAPASPSGDIVWGETLHAMDNARFAGERDIRIQKMGDAGLSRPFPAPNYHPKTARLYQTPDGKWRISISCEEPDPESYAGEPDCGPDPGH